MVIVWWILFRKIKWIFSIRHVGEILLFSGMQFDWKDASVKSTSRIKDEDDTDFESTKKFR